MNYSSRIFIFIVSASLLFNCSEGVKTVIIDNPTDQTLELLIDDKTATVVPFDELRFTIAAGKHTLTINGKEKPFNLTGGNEFLLNPTESIYIIEDILYGNDSENMNLKWFNDLRTVKNKVNAEDQDVKKFILLDTISFEGNELIGFYKKENSLVIERNWDLGALEGIPNKNK